MQRGYPSFQLDGMRSAEHHVMRTRQHVEATDKSVAFYVFYKKFVRIT